MQNGNEKRPEITSDILARIQKVAGNYATRYGLDRNAAEDIAQDICVELLRNKTPARDAEAWFTTAIHQHATRIAARYAAERDTIAPRREPEKRPDKNPARAKLDELEQQLAVETDPAEIADLREQIAILEAKLLPPAMEPQANDPDGGNPVDSAPSREPGPLDRAISAERDRSVCDRIKGVADTRLRAFTFLLMETGSITAAAQAMSITYPEALAMKRQLAKILS